MALEWLTTAALRRDIADFERREAAGGRPMPGKARRARHLLRLDPRLRLAAECESEFLVNTQPGWRPSDALLRCVERIENATR